MTPPRILPFVFPKDPPKPPTPELRPAPDRRGGLRIRVTIEPPPDDPPPDKP